MWGFCKKIGGGGNLLLCLGGGAAGDGGSAQILFLLHLLQKLFYLTMTFNILVLMSQKTAVSQHFMDHRIDPSWWTHWAISHCAPRLV